MNGISLERAVSRMKRFPGVGGRMQLIQQGQPFQVIIDFAHTPDGLQMCLKHLRK